MLAATVAIVAFGDDSRTRQLANLTWILNLGIKSPNLNEIQNQAG